MNNKLQENRLPSIMLLQAFALACVIVGHVTRIYYYPGGWYCHEPQTQSFIFNQITKVIYTFHMPLFVFLSGYLGEKSLSINGENIFIIKRFKRLVIPFWFWGLVYCVPIWSFLKFPQYDYFSFITGQSIGHLWFLPLLLYVSFIYLFIRKIPSRYSFLIACVLFSLIFIKYEEFDSFSVFRITEFLFFYFVGAKFFAFEKKKIFSNKLFLSCLSFLLFIIFALLEYSLFSSGFKDDFKIPFISIFAIFFFVFIAKIFSLKYGDMILKNKVINFLSKYLLGFYILNEPIIELILNYIGWGDGFNPFATCAIVFFGSILITLFVLLFFIFLNKKMNWNLNFML